MKRKLKRIVQLGILLLMPSMTMAQWNTNVMENMQIASSTGNSSKVFHTNDGYFLAYSEGMQAKVHFYNFDGTPNWSSSMLPNNHPVGDVVYNRYTVLDHSGHIINFSNCLGNNDEEMYAMNKISTAGTQQWNGAAGVTISGFVVGAHVAADNSVYVIKQDGHLLKYSSSGVLLWTTFFGLDQYDFYSNPSIVEKLDGSIGMAYLAQSSDFPDPAFGKYHYSAFNNDGVILNTSLLSTDYAPFYIPTILLKDENEMMYFVFTTATEEFNTHVQKIVNDVILLPGDGYDIDLSTAYNNIFKSAIIKNNQLHVLYEYYLLDVPQPPSGLKGQIIDLNTFTRLFDQGNTLISDTANDVYVYSNELINHGSDFGFLVLDKPSQQLDYKIFNGSTLTQSIPVCTTTTEKWETSISTLNNIDASKAQVVVLFPDDRNNDFDPQLYAQNLQFGTLDNGDHIKNNKGIKVYPNPSGSLLHFATELSIEELKIYTITGQELATAATLTPIDVSNWAKGVYFIEFLTEDKQLITHKFIVE